MSSFPLSPSYNSGGEAWDALVPITYVNPDNNQNVNITVELDTGAIYSLAPLSLASILGLSLTSGTPITLTGVNGQGFAAYLHPLSLEIGGVRFDGVLVAIASNEDVPFLLGRTNFWDFASIKIDDVNHLVYIDPVPGAGTAVQTTTSPTPIIVSLLGVAGALAVFYFLVKK